MPSSDLPTPPTDTVAPPPADEAPVTGHDSPAPDPEESAAPAVDTPEPTSEPEPPAAEAEATPEPEPAAKTKAEPTPEPAAKAKAEPTPEPEPAAATEPKAEPAPATTAKAEPVATPAAKPPLQPSTKPVPRPAAAPTRTNASKAAVAIGLVVLLGAAAAGVFLIAADSDTADPTAQPTPAASSAAAATPTPAASSAAAVPATGDITKIKVTGTDKPVIEVPAPFAVAKTSTRVLTPGKGKVLAAGENVTIDFVGVNGTSGKTFETSYGKTEPVTFLFGDKNLIKGMMDGLTGVKVGSRVLLAIPAADGYGTKGSPDAGIGPTDTLLFVIDVKSATKPLTRATGTAVAPKAGLPTVVLDSSGKPTITVPKSAAPTSLVVQPLIKGTGATVAKGQSITVNYTGAIWASGKVFDSSWTNGAPATFAIGTGNVIPGWDKGLVGQKVGSQVLLAIPPADGYGTAGQPSAGIAGTDTLVFVVDILAAS